MDINEYDAMWYQSELSKALAVIDALEADNVALHREIEDLRAQLDAARQSQTPSD